MRLRIKKRPRKFKVGLNETVLKDFGKIYLKDKEQITFVIKTQNTMWLKLIGGITLPLL